MATKSVVGGPPAPPSSGPDNKATSSPAPKKPRHSAPAAEDPKTLKTPPDDKITSKGTPDASQNQVDETSNVQAMAAYAPNFVLSRLAGGMEPTKPSVETFDGSVLFIDLSGFTRLASGLQSSSLPPHTQPGPGGAEKLSMVLNSHFRRLISTIVTLYGGDVVKFAGDAIVVVWSVPDSSVSPTSPTAQPSTSSSSTSSGDHSSATADSNSTSETSQAQASSNPVTTLSLIEVAISCAMDVMARFHNYALANDMVDFHLHEEITLGLHMSVGGGSTIAFQVGTDSWELLFAGDAMHQVSTGLADARNGDIVVSAQAWSALHNHYAPQLTSNAFIDAITDGHGSLLQTGAVRLTIPHNFRRPAQEAASPSSSARSLPTVSQSADDDGISPLPNLKRRSQFKRSKGHKPDPPFHWDTLDDSPMVHSHSRTSSRIFRAQSRVSLRSHDSSHSNNSANPNPLGSEAIDRIYANINDTSKALRSLAESVKASLTSTMIPTLKPYLSRSLFYLMEAANESFPTTSRTDESVFVGDLRTVTVLFINIGAGGALDRVNYRSTSSLGELQAVMSILQDTLESQGAAVNKWLLDDKGSSVLAAFGVQGQTKQTFNDSDAIRGVDAAMTIHERLAERGHHVAIGITTGKAFCGPVGSPKRREFTILGEVVNFASRLMSQGPERGIVADQTTAAATKQRFKYEEFSTLIKGAPGPVDAYRLSQRMKILPSQGADGVPAPGSKTTLVGRDYEIAIFKDVLRHLNTKGVGTALLIESEVGMGKTRLIREFETITLDKGLAFARGAANSPERNTPYYAWRSVFNTLLKLSQYSSDEGRINALRSVLRESENPDALELIPLLNPVLSMNVPETDLTSSMSPAQRAKTTQDLLLELLLTVTSIHRHVIVLSDVHWLDMPSTRLAMVLTQHLHNVMIVFTTRPQVGSIDGLASLKGIIRIPLRPLAPHETIQLVCNHLGVALLPHPLVDVILDRSHGNPLFIEEFALALKQKYQIENVNGLAVLNTSGSITDIDLPNTIQSIIIARINQLNFGEQFTLKVASVIGRAFTLEILHAIYPIESVSQSTLVEHLNRLHFLRFIVWDSKQVEKGVNTLVYAFRQPTVQEVAYNILLFVHRQKLHLAIAEWYETHHGQNLASFSSLLIHHLLCAGELGKAAKYLMMAGNHALRNHAETEAVRSFQQLADIRDQVPDSAGIAWAAVERKLGNALLATGQRASGEARLLSALKQLHQPNPAGSMIKVRLSITRASLTLKYRRGRERYSCWGSSQTGLRRHPSNGRSSGSSEERRVSNSATHPAAPSPDPEAVEASSDSVTHPLDAESAPQIPSGSVGTQSQGPGQVVPQGRRKSSIRFVRDGSPDNTSVILPSPKIPPARRSSIRFLTNSSSQTSTKTSSPISRRASSIRATSSPLAPGRDRSGDEVLSLLEMLSSDVPAPPTVQVEPGRPKKRNPLDSSTMSTRSASVTSMVSLPSVEDARRGSMKSVGSAGQLRRFMDSVKHSSSPTPSLDIPGSFQVEDDGTDSDVTAPSLFPAAEPWTVPKGKRRSSIVPDFVSDSNHGGTSEATSGRMSSAALGGVGPDHDFLHSVGGRRISTLTQISGLHSDMDMEYPGFTRRTSMRSGPNLRTDWNEDRARKTARHYLNRQQTGGISNDNGSTSSQTSLTAPSLTHDQVMTQEAVLVYLSYADLVASESLPRHHHAIIHATTLAETLPLSPYLMQCYLELAVLMRLRRSDLSQYYVNKAQEVYDSLPERAVTKARFVLYGGHFSMFNGALKEACLFYRDAYIYYKDLGDIPSGVLAVMSSALAALYRGDWNQALYMLDIHVALSHSATGSSSQSSPGSGGLLNLLAKVSILLRPGQTEDATSYMMFAQNKKENSRNVDVAALTVMESVEAIHQLRNGNPNRAVPMVMKALDSIVNSPPVATILINLFQVLALLNCAEALTDLLATPKDLQGAISMDDVARSQDKLIAGLTKASSKFQWLEPHLHLYKGLQAAAMGWSDKAEAHWRAALDCIEEEDRILPLEKGKLHVFLALHLHNANVEGNDGGDNEADEREVSRHLEVARDLFADIGAEQMLDRVNDFIRRRNMGQAVYPWGGLRR